MKKTGVALLCLVLVAGSAFAGGLGQRKEIRQVLQDDPLPRQLNSTPIKVQVIEKETVVLRDLAKDSASAGFAIGLHGSTPELAFKLDNGLELAAGYTRTNNDQRGLLRASYRFHSSETGWTQLKAGASAFPGTPATAGIFLEAEQYIASWASLLGTIYPVTLTTGPADLMSGVVGARLYL